MLRIKVKNPIVEMDGDEMTRILWKSIKDKLILPHLDIELKYFDLGMKHRDETDDRVTVESAEAIRQYGVGVKCATITPNADRVKEYSLKKAWPSPNGTIRALLDGTVFRKPIVVKNVPPMVRSWKKPITIGRHAYGDVYKNAEIAVPGPGKAELVFSPLRQGSGGQAGADGESRITIHDFKGPGVIQGIHNTDESIRSFARACFQYALSEKMELWFAAKDTISKTYHGRFRDIFAQEAVPGVKYFYTLIDDAVARVMRHEGGILWACMNYDGDVFSDMLASGFGSLGLMTSVLVSPSGAYEYEAAHGTVQQHYYKHLKGETTSTNSTASIFAWTGAIRKRGELDGTPDISAFADKLEKAVIDTIESGTMTKDLALIAHPEPKAIASTEEFIDAIAHRLLPS